MMTFSHLSGVPKSIKTFLLSAILSFSVSFADASAQSEVNEQQQGSHIEGALTSADLNYLRGFAYSSGLRHPVEVWLFSQESAPGAPLLLIPTKVIANQTLEPHDNLQPKFGFDFKVLTPDFLKDGRNHRIYAFTVNRPDREHMLAGSPRIFNSNLYYKQEPIENLRWNAQVSYTPEFLNQHKNAHNGLLNPFAARNDNSGRTTVAAWSAPANPFSQKINRQISNLTGLEMPQGNFDNQFGVEAGPCGIQALQSNSTAIGISLAPRAISRKPLIWGLYPGAGWNAEAAPKPFFSDKNNRIRMQGWFRHPYTGITSIGQHSISEEGMVFYYFTLQFADRVHKRLTADGRRVSNTVWFDVRLYQDKMARPLDQWDQLKNKEGLAVDPSDQQNKFAVIDTILRPASTRISVPQNSAPFSMRPYEGERFHSFELSGLQFERALEQFNQAHLVPQHFSTNCADYSLITYNIDVESWNPGTLADARIGMSFRDISIRLIPAAPITQ